MPRLKQVPKNKADTKVAQPLYHMVFGERDPVAEPGTATGTPGDWWTVFANSPATLKHAAQGFAYYRSSERKLDPALRELGQVWAGWATESQFVYSQHCKSLRALGVPDALFEELRAEFSDEEILELTYATCLYHMHAIMSRALRTEFDDRDDPITEVPAPDGYDEIAAFGPPPEKD